MKRSEAMAYRAKIEQAAVLLDDATALESVALFPSWRSGISVTTGERYKYNEVLYKVVQSHITQEDWTPDITPALFAPVSVDEWPEWVQPTGVQDAYMIGDKVTFEEKHYISLIDNNTWSPTVYPAGWEEQP